MLLSGVFRAAAVALIGAGPVVVLVYEVVFEASVAFHHSNWRLPYLLERVLNWIVVTPRMHGIHHSIVHRETDSNYSNIFSIWDRLFGTYTSSIDFRTLNYGLDGFDIKERQTLDGLLKMPFMNYNRV